MTAAPTEFQTAELEKARGEIFAALDRCPCCGAERTDSSKNRAMQNVEFACHAIFYRLTGSAPSVSRPCSGPSHAAVRGLEIEAGKVVAS